MDKRFSICHTTARPQGWQCSYEAWRAGCYYWPLVEYVLCMDVRWGFTWQDAEKARALGIKVVWNVGRKCMVDGYGYAAAASTGQVLILNSDDILPPAGWFESLEAVIGTFNPNILEFVIETRSGTAADARGLMVLQIMSRARYEAQGYALYPGYESMYADDDFSQHARLDDCVLDGRHLLFAHEHPDMQTGELDAVYKHQNREGAYAVGQWMLDLRRSAKFGVVSFNMQRTPKRIAFMLPGENFSARWTWSLIQLFTVCGAAGYEVQLFWGQSSSVFEVRFLLRQEVLNWAGGRFDLVLMLDDDNVLTFEQLQQMIAELEGHPELSGVTAWTWIQPDAVGAIPIVSCGRLLEDGRTSPFTPAEMREAAGLLELEYSGFPCLLLRYDALKAAGDDCYLPIFSKAFKFGMSGEDYAFFVRTRAKGMRWCVDPRLCIPHLKTRAITAPTLDQEPIDLTVSAVPQSPEGAVKELQRV